MKNSELFEFERESLLNSKRKNQEKSLGTRRMTRGVWPNFSIKVKPMNSTNNPGISRNIFMNLQKNQTPTKNTAQKTLHKK